MADPTVSQGPQGYWLLDTARATGIGVWLGNTLGSVTERWAEKEVSVSYLAPLAQETRPPPHQCCAQLLGLLQLTLQRLQSTLPSISVLTHPPTEVSRIINPFCR